LPNPLGYPGRLPCTHIPSSSSSRPKIRAYKPSEQKAGGDRSVVGFQERVTLWLCMRGNVPWCWMLLPPTKPCLCSTKSPRGRLETMAPLSHRARMRFGRMAAGCWGCRDACPITSSKPTRRRAQPSCHFALRAPITTCTLLTRALASIHPARRLHPQPCDSRPLVDPHRGGRGAG
jgi:hypothetical protein